MASGGSRVSRRRAWTHWGSVPPSQVLFSKKVCKDERIGSYWGVSLDPPVLTPFLQKITILPITDSCIKLVLYCWAITLFCTVQSTFTLYSGSTFTNKCLFDFTNFLLHYCELRLLDGVRNNFPQWREPLSVPCTSLKPTAIRLVYFFSNFWNGLQDGCQPQGRQNME